MQGAYLAKGPVRQARAALRIRTRSDTSTRWRTKKVERFYAQFHHLRRGARCRGVRGISFGVGADAGPVLVESGDHADRIDLPGHATTSSVPSVSPRSVVPAGRYQGRAHAASGFIICDLVRAAKLTHAPDLFRSAKWSARFSLMAGFTGLPIDGRSRFGGRRWISAGLGNNRKLVQGTAGREQMGAADRATAS